MLLKAPPTTWMGWCLTTEYQDDAKKNKTEVVSGADGGVIYTSSK